MFNFLQVRKRAIFMFVGINRIVGDSKLQFRARKKEDFVIIVEDRKYQNKDKVNDSKKKTIIVVAFGQWEKK